MKRGGRESRVSWCLSLLCVIWTGDKIFLDLLAREVPFFSLKLSYEGDTLVQAVLNGKELSTEI